MSRYLLLLQTLVLAVLIALAGPAQAGKKGYWTWNDEKGNPQYSDRPPEGVANAVFVEKNTTNSAVSPPYQSGNQGGTAEGEAAGTMEALAKKDPAICEQAKANLSALQGARVRITEADGSQHYLTEDEKQAEKDRNQKLIDLNC